MQVTISGGLKTNPDATMKALVKEASSLLDLEAIEPVNPKLLTPQQIATAPPSVTFGKHKYKPDGTYDKFKVRTAFGNHRNYEEIKDITSSPTVDLTSVFIVLSIAASHNLLASVMDIGSAFLNAKFPDHLTVLMKLDKFTTSALVNLPRGEQYRNYILNDGSMIVKLKKALYGHPLASMLWYKHLSNTLAEAGYKRLIADKCVFTKIVGDSISIICLHVDDILHVYSRSEIQERLEDVLIKTYKNVTTHTGEELNYLGMCTKFDRNLHCIYLDQRGYIEEMLQHFNIQGTAVSPATQELFSDKPTTAQDMEKIGKITIDELKSIYASKVMKLMYLAKRTRPDILLATSYLATKLQQPTMVDLQKVNRIFKYINATKGEQLKLTCNSLQLHCYIDASFNVHPKDSKSHSGAIFTLGDKGGPIFVKSSKQKMVSRSSTEAELNAVYDHLPQILWIKQLLHEIFPERGDVLQPAVLYQDNTSTITLEKRGNFLLGKSKHILLRYNYIYEQIEEGKVKVVHLPTDEMKADPLTKPMTADKTKRYLLSQ